MLPSFAKRNAVGVSQALPICHVGHDACTLRPSDMHIDNDENHVNDDKVDNIDSATKPQAFNFKLSVSTGVTHGSLSM